MFQNGPFVQRGPEAKGAETYGVIWCPRASLASSVLILVEDDVDRTAWPIAKLNPLSGREMWRV
jgi:hypothetical protein